METPACVRRKRSFYTGASPSASPVLANAMEKVPARAMSRAAWIRSGKRCALPCVVYRRIGDRARNNWSDGHEAVHAVPFCCQGRSEVAIGLCRTGAGTENLDFKDKVWRAGHRWHSSLADGAVFSLPITLPTITSKWSRPSPPPPACSRHPRACLHRARSRALQRQAEQSIRALCGPRSCATPYVMATLLSNLRPRMHP